MKMSEKLVEKLSKNLCMFSSMYIAEKDALRVLRRDHCGVVTRLDQSTGKFHAVGVSAQFVSSDIYRIIPENVPSYLLKGRECNHVYPVVLEKRQHVCKILVVDVPPCVRDEYEEQDGVYTVPLVDLNGLVGFNGCGFDGDYYNFMLCVSDNGSPIIADTVRFWF